MTLRHSRSTKTLSKHLQIQFPISWQGSGYAVTPDGSIYFPEAPADFILVAETANYDSAGLFIHEMTHVMQYQQGMNVLGTGLLLQGAKFGSFGLYDPYKFTYTPGAGLNSYNIEQQGELARGAYHGLFPNLFK